MPLGESGELFLDRVVDFEDWWKEYPARGRTPRRSKKRVARVAFEALSVTDKQRAWDGLLVAKATRDWLEPRFIPEAHRWLRDRRWEDEPLQGKTYTPKERKMLKSWRSRVGSYCPPDHGEPQCGGAEACNEKQLVKWTTQGVL